MTQSRRPPASRFKRLTGVEQLEPRTLLAARPIINEFSASNDGPLLDGFGQSSDWIELYNSGDEPADLGGYFLTDDADDLDKWSFPAETQLDPREYLLVFASGLNLTDSASHPHTNFELRAEGEYLALVAPNRRVVSEFGAGRNFGRQFPDISYGLGQSIREDRLVGPSSVGQVFVPRDGELPEEWSTAGFQAGNSWRTGSNGFGYDMNSGLDEANGTAVLRLDVNDNDSGEANGANSETGWQSFDLDRNGSSYDGIKVTLSAIGGIPLEGRDRDGPADAPPSLTYDQLYDDFVFARSQTDGTGIEILVEGLTPEREYAVTLLSYDVGSIGSRVSNWIDVTHDPPVVIEASYSFDGREPVTSNSDYTISARMTASRQGMLRIHGVRNGGTSFGVFLNAIEIVVPNTERLIQTDIGPDMHNRGSSAYIRLPFTIAEPVDYEQLELNLQYDSGFVAYLDGQEIARRNVGGVAGDRLPFNAVASSERSLDATVQRETIDVSRFAARIGAGSHVLAIHGLNSAADNDDFLMRAELTATDASQLSPIYFGSPTPGAANSGPTYRGLVAGTVFSVERGFYTQPFTVEVSSETLGASIAYTLDGSEPSPTHGTIVAAGSDGVAPKAVVPISTTSFLRALAFKAEFLPSDVDTQSYIFLEDVLRQNPQPGAGSPRYPATWQATQYTGDYAMDARVVAKWDDHDPANSDFGIRQSLLSLPTMSIVMDHEDLWGASRGIYNHGTSTGTAWRRRGSLEYFDPHTGEELQVNAGIQIHGGASRDNERTKKHSFRIVFNEDFGGPARIDFPLFKDSPISEINTIVLKSFFTDGFPTRTITGRYSPLDSQYLRDTWIRDVRLAMGGLDARSEYVHLYINGLYWGLYSPTERPDDAFMASYVGGQREDFDIIKDFNELFRGEKAAWNAMFTIARSGLTSQDAYQRIQGHNPDGNPNPDLPNYLDVDNLIEYMIQHLYSGPEDWPHHNWYAARDRAGETDGFQFFSWDQEIILDGRFRDRTNVSDAFTPAYLYSRLRQNAEFKIRFADLVQKHLFHDGPLTVENAQKLWMRRADQIEKAIIAESARWGDAREGERRQIDERGPLVTIPLLTIDLWRTERDNVRDNYLPRSHQLAIERFRADGLYPNINPPAFSQRGGFVTSSTDIQILAAEGDIYYTTDGSDPRLPGGAIGPTAIKYTRPVRLSVDATIRFRALDGETWSAIDEAFFEVDKVAATSDNLRVSEVMYNPVDADAEFLELANIGNQTISLRGLKLTGGVRFDFAASSITSLKPGERIVVVRDLPTFWRVYDVQNISIAGQYDGRLADEGDRVQVETSAGSIVVSFDYDDGNAGWALRASNFGHSLELAFPDDDPSSPNSWIASANAGGTPGQASAISGDANLDGMFTSTDLVLVFQASEYEDLFPANSTWFEGDWNGDGEFTSADLVLAFRVGAYK